MDVDQKYNRSPAGRARQAKYNAGRKGRARRRRWAKANRERMTEYGTLYRREYRKKKKKKAA